MNRFLQTKRANNQVVKHEAKLLIRMLAADGRQVTFRQAKDALLKTIGEDGYFDCAAAVLVLRDGIPPEKAREHVLKLKQEALAEERSKEVSS